MKSRSKVGILCALVFGLGPVFAGLVAGCEGDELYAPFSSPRGGDAKGVSEGWHDILLNHYWPHGVVAWYHDDYPNPPFEVLDEGLRSRFRIGEEIEPGGLMMEGSGNPVPSSFFSASVPGPAY